MREREEKITEQRERERKRKRVNCINEQEELLHLRWMHTSSSFYLLNWTIVLPLSFFFLSPSFSLERKKYTEKERKIWRERPHLLNYNQEKEGECLLKTFSRTSNKFDHQEKFLSLLSSFFFFFLATYSSLLFSSSFFYPKEKNFVTTVIPFAQI